MTKIGAIVSGREAYGVTKRETVRGAARYMADRRVGAVAVLDGSRLVGILSERDVMTRVVAAGLDPDATAVEAVMTRELLVTGPAASYAEGLREMRAAGCRHLPVIDGERFLGMVAQRDLLQIDLDEKSEEIRWLNAYIHDVPGASPR
jgi:CBS domain-containing protein